MYCLKKGTDAITIFAVPAIILTALILLNSCLVPAEKQSGTHGAMHERSEASWAQTRSQGLFVDVDVILNDNGDPENEVVMSVVIWWLWLEWIRYSHFLPTI